VQGTLERNGRCKDLTLCAPRVQTADYGVIMAVMAKSWTDERLEERFDRIDQRFDEVDRRFEQVDRRFDEVERHFEQRFGSIESDFRELRGEMNKRFDAMQRLIIQMLVTLIVGFAGVIATLATQL
jgi:hypothetical protein